MNSWVGESRFNNLCHPLIRDQGDWDIMTNQDFLSTLCESGKRRSEIPFANQNAKSIRVTNLDALDVKREIRQFVFLCQLHNHLIRKLT